MNRLVVVLFFIVACLVAGNGRAAVTAYSSVKTDYAFAEFGFVQDTTPVVQSGITVSKGNCFTDIWTSFAVDLGNEGNEIDYTFGCGTKVGDFEVNTSISYFDLPTPSAIDFDFPSDAVRLRVEASRTLALDGNDSLKIWAGADRIVGILETWSIRAGTTWAHNFDDQWSSRVGIGATHQTYDSYTGLWGTTAVDYRMEKGVSLGALIDWYSGDSGENVTSGLRISKSW